MSAKLGYFLPQRILAEGQSYTPIVEILIIALGPQPGPGETAQLPSHLTTTNQHHKINLMKNLVQPSRLVFSL